ncbi:hypothetical protein ACIPW4_25985 [Pseudomonas sp. NPDC089996]|uniref:hypothetical protein n=1 Tax=Pseudomonas sp. NPDC089996 TaxID=3364474 RepID=UPI00382BEABE
MGKHERREQRQMQGQQAEKNASMLSGESLDLLCVSESSPYEQFGRCQYYRYGTSAYQLAWQACESVDFSVIYDVFAI